MSDGIFLLQGKTLVELLVQPYDSEALLQQLLADYPNLIAGNQIDRAAPRRWLLISREMAVPDAEDGGARWSLDHLFVDQDGIPTLVEVKRSSDTRIRREVVGQMFDYAANAVAYWPVEELQRRFQERCDRTGLEPDTEIGNVLGPDVNTADFWGKVKTNLQAGKIRMIFIADEIPKELQRIIEFLNVQMDPAEVLGLEIKQYVRDDLKTLVPRVIGQTAEAQQRKSASSPIGKSWDEASYFSRIEEQAGSAAAAVARKILDWARNRAFYIWWGKGKRSGSFGGAITLAGVDRYLFAVYTYGAIEIYFQWLKNNPPFSDEGMRLEFLARLNKIPGVALPPNSITRRPSIKLEALNTTQAFDQLLVAIDWALSEIRRDADQGQNPGDVR